MTKRKVKTPQPIDTDRIKAKFRHLQKRWGCPYVLSDAPQVQP